MYLALTDRNVSLSMNQRHFKFAALLMDKRSTQSWGREAACCELSGLAWHAFGAQVEELKKA